MTCIFLYRLPQNRYLCTVRKSWIILLLTAVSCSRGYETVGGFAQGGTYSVCYNASPVKISRERIAREVDALLLQIDTTLSGYNRNSQLSRLNAGDTLLLSPMFAELYALSYDLWRCSDGVLDVAAGPLFDIWGFGFSRDSLPSPERVSGTLASCGMHRLKAPYELDFNVPLCASDFLRESGGEAPRLNFNAVAQGYSCDVIAAYLHTLGVKDMLVNIGEIYLEGLNPQGRGWTVGVDTPTDGNHTPGASLSGMWQSDGGGYGVVTSGNYRKFYLHEGQKYAHTLDPRDGCPVQHSLLSATVTVRGTPEQRSATLADAYATWFMVVGADAALEICQTSGSSLPVPASTETLLITADTLLTTPGFRLLSR